MRQKKRYEFIWRLVESIVGAGFDVWITDANKLWFRPEKLSEFSRDERRQLRQLQCEVLRREMELVDPVRTLAFGTKAQRSLKRLGVDHVKHPHPSVRWVRPLKEAYGLEKGNFGYDARYSAAWKIIEGDLRTFA